MKYIYTISAQRGQKAPEIFYITDNYYDSIIYLYEFILKHEGKISDDYSYYTDFYQLNEFPLDTNFAPVDNWSKIQMTKSSKYRIKFKNWGDLKRKVFTNKKK